MSNTTQCQAGWGEGWVSRLLRGVLICEMVLGFARWSWGDLEDALKSAHCTGASSSVLFSLGPAGWRPWHRGPWLCPLGTWAQTAWSRCAGTRASGRDCALEQEEGGETADNRTDPLKHQGQGRCPEPQLSERLWRKSQEVKPGEVVPTRTTPGQSLKWRTVTPMGAQNVPEEMNCVWKSKCGTRPLRAQQCPWLVSSQCAEAEHMRTERGERGLPIGCCVFMQPSSWGDSLAKPCVTPRKEGSGSESHSAVSDSATPTMRLRNYTVHGILQARTLESVAFPFSRRSSQPRAWTQVSCIARRILYQPPAESLKRQPKIEPEQLTEGNKGNFKILDNTKQTEEWSAGQTAKAGKTGSIVCEEQRPSSRDSGWEGQRLTDEDVFPPKCPAWLTFTQWSSRQPWVGTAPAHGAPAAGGGAPGQTLGGRWAPGITRLEG